MCVKNATITYQQQSRGTTQKQNKSRHHPALLNDWYLSAETMMMNHKSITMKNVHR